MLPTRSATSTCIEVGSTATTTGEYTSVVDCVYQYQPEIYYHDFATFFLFALFLLSFPVVGLFLSRVHK